jgi:hypothetical protein
MPSPNPKGRRRLFRESVDARRFEGIESAACYNARGLEAYGP